MNGNFINLIEYNLFEIYVISLFFVFLFVVHLELWNKFFLLCCAVLLYFYKYEIKYEYKGGSNQSFSVFMSIKKIFLCCLIVRVGWMLCYGGELVTEEVETVFLMFSEFLWGRFTSMTIFMVL